MKKTFVIVALIFVLFTAACEIGAPTAEDLYVPLIQALEQEQTYVIYVEEAVEEIEEAPGISALREYLGVGFAIQTSEFALDDYRWQFLELANELNWDNFPVTFSIKPRLDALVDLSEEGDVFILTTPDGYQYLHINVGSTRHLQFNRFYTAKLDIPVELYAEETVHIFTDLDTEALEHQRYIRDKLFHLQIDIGSVILANNHFGAGLVERNQAIIDAIPTCDWLLDISIGPQHSIQSNHPYIIEKAEYITHGLDNDMDKARAIHRWVARNIRYDEGWFDYFIDGGSRLHPGEEGGCALFVLRERIATCGGFTNLTVALLKAADIPALYISTDFDDAETEKHALYAAFVDGRWILGDSTWGYPRHFDLSMERFTHTNLGYQRIIGIRGAGWGFSRW